MNIVLITDNWTCWSYRAAKAFELLGHTTFHVYNQDRSPGEAPKSGTLYHEFDLAVLCLGGHVNAVEFFNIYPRTPYLIYCGDMMSVGKPAHPARPTEDMLYKNARCKGIILSSPGWQPYITSRGYNKPTVVLYPYVPEDVFPHEAKPKFKDGRVHMVIIGSSGRYYRDYTESIKEALARGEVVHEYVNEPTGIHGVIPHDRLPQKALMDALTRYNVGLCGFTTPMGDPLEAYTNSVVQIKIFDYWASGLKIRCLQGNNVRKFVEEHVSDDRYDAIMTLDHVRQLEEVLP